MADPQESAPPPSTPEAAPAAFEVPGAPAPRGRQRLLILIATALAAFVACAALALIGFVLFTPAGRNLVPMLAAKPSDAPPPEAPNKFVTQPAGRVSISDDFSQASSRWDRSQSRLTGGAYEISLDLDNFDSYGLFLGAGNVRDFDLAVDATQTAGPAEGEFGIRFRQSAPDEHLMFSISASGYYRLVRVSNKAYTSLVPWTRFAKLKLGPGVTNRLRVVADGPKLTGYIHGEQVLTFNDTAQESGQLTLGLVTFATGGLVVRFDNLAGFAQTMLPTGTPTKLDLAEDFSNPATAKWSVGGATVSGGAYEVFVGGAVVAWQPPLPTGASELKGDFVLEVDAALLSGPTKNSAYGLMFGDAGDFGFFALLIIPDGRIIMYRNGDAGYTVFPALPLAAIKAGLKATNHLKVEVRGRNCTITVNEQALPPIALPDGITMDGMVGLIVQGADAEGARVRFDNFRLEALSQQDAVVWPGSKGETRSHFQQALTPPRPVRPQAPLAGGRLGRTTC